LKRTQDELREQVAASTPPDPDFIEAIAENQDVMFVAAAGILVYDFLTTSSSEDRKKNVW
jgi:hypothetical protein